MFIREKQVIYDDNTCHVTAGYVESDGTVHFDVKDPKTGNLFVVHVLPDGRMNVKYFTTCKNVSFHCSAKGIREICRVYMENGIIPRINIIYTNKALISICTHVGFRKVKNVKHLYVLKKLKEI